jgi:glycosyltransferase involved in cell wall biosynthesis
MNKKKIGIVATCNIYGGINKLISMMANDIANENNQVIIYTPIIPFFTYYFRIFKKPFFWFRKIAPEHLKRWVFNRKFCCLDMLDNKKIKLNFIKTKWVLATINKKSLESLDCIIFNGIGDVVEYQKSNIQKQIYLINQIEEIHSGYKDIFEKIRREFKGKSVTHCNEMKKKLSNQYNNLEIIPNPISKGLWKFKNLIDFDKIRNEILIYQKNDNFNLLICKFLDEILILKPNIRITVFARTLYGNKKIKFLSKKYKFRLLFDQNESQVANLYLNHSFLFYPNTFEDFGMPPVESLSCGCIPILRPNVGAAEMYSVDDFNSIHLDNDYKSTAKKVTDILNNKEQLIRLRKNTVKNLEQFDPNNYGNKILNL